MSDPITCLNAALEGRYHIERELGEGGMAHDIARLSGWTTHRGVCPSLVDQIVLLLDPNPNPPDDIGGPPPARPRLNLIRIAIG